MNLKKIMFFSLLLGVFTLGISIAFAVASGLSSKESIQKVFREKYSSPDEFSMEVLETSTFPTDKVSALTLNLAAGDLKVIPSTDEQIHVTVRGRVPKQSENGSANVLKSTVSENRLVLTIDQESIKERWKGTSKWGGSWNFEFSTEMEVDLALPLGIKATELNLAAGDVDIKNLTLDTFTINAAAGDVDVQGLVVKNLTTSLAAGDLDGDLSVENLKSELLAGDIDLKVKNPAPVMDLNAAAGDVKINFLQTPDMKMKFDVMAGDLSVKGFSKEQLEKPVTLGKGTGRLSVDSLAGDIKITY